ncbi:hypothetical protein NPIL_620151 [Nephila pilipes]|uniref:Uncharacterized protein n=1 Tax=Nephila pilipes TaxID=299642 RepID=A0A8X6QJX9_NEPPI|nr:hypothetical protein NPIL_620151 [Nephila pilipes]
MDEQWIYIGKFNKNLKKQNKSGNIRWPNLKDTLEKQIKEQQGKRMKILTLKIGLQAKFMVYQKNINDFKGVLCWCSKFMPRKEKKCAYQNSQARVNNGLSG